MTQNKFSRLGAIGAIAQDNSNDSLLTEETPVTSLTPANTEQQGGGDKIFRMVAELEAEDIERFLDLKYHLTSELGNCTNKDVVKMALDMVYKYMESIKPRPESVKAREQIYFRTPSKRKKR